MTAHNSNKDHASSGIGTLQETSLHAALKTWYARDEDQIEAQVDGYVIDLLRDGLLIEIQTGHFSAIKAKVNALLEHHPLRLVYPVPQVKWILRVDSQDRQIKRRKSPKRGRVEHLFRELVRMPETAARPNFSLEVLLTEEEEVWKDDGQGSWRRGGWSIADRRLLAVVDQVEFIQPADYARLIPEGLPRPFTNRELADALRLRLRTAQRATYCLVRMGVLREAGRRGRAHLFAEAAP